jgi:biopolymer transport protein ExbB
MAIIEWLKSGGPVMIPLIFCSLLSLAIIIEKLINLREKKIINEEDLETTSTLLSEGFFDKAEGFLRGKPGVLSSIILTAIESRDLPREEIKEAVADVGRHEAAKLEKYLGVLGTIAAISPLLGLLGTVTGMIKTFRIISVTGVGQAGALSVGIAEALITTVTGLSIAIPTLVMYNLFLERAERIIRRIEKYSIDFLKMITGVKGQEKDKEALRKVAGSE